MSVLTITTRVHSKIVDRGNRLSFYESKITTVFKAIQKSKILDLSVWNNISYILPVLVAVAGAIFGSLSWQPEANIQAATISNDRYGVIISGASDSVVRNNLNTLQMGWWYEFTGSDTNPAGYNKVLLIRTPQDGLPKSASELRAMTTKNPGAHWMIGNEPNVPGQDDVTPSRYAELFNYYATNIKAMDPNAKLVGPNVLNWDDTCSACGGFTSGHEWTSSFRSGYQTRYGAEPPIDVWGIHSYYINWGKLPMVDYQISIKQLTAMREYLNAISAHATKPIWITEFGVIWGYDGRKIIANSECANGFNCSGPEGSYRADLIKEYMNGFLGWLNTNADSQNIKKWFIYISHGSPEPYSSVFAGISLFDKEGETGCLSEMGMLYAQLAGGQISSPCPSPSTFSPTISGPADGTVFSNLAPLLTWSNPPGTTQYNIHIIPANDDGPAITLIRNAESSYQVVAPKLGQGNYVILPGMTYTWKVRTTDANVWIPESDSRWGSWATGAFKTAPPSSNNISPISPTPGITVNSLTPALVWQDTDDKMFYYEIQVTKDPTFNTNSSTATAMVYWELRHGGETNPINSYTIPSNFPLEPKTTYYWRVRARVQGDGIPVAWSTAWSFQTP